jgi:tubulin---tyrosine ligase
MSSALSQTRSIALSYGTMDQPPPQILFDPAHALSVKIVRDLWENWGRDEGGLRNGEIDLYSVNIPMIQELLSEGGLPVIWTRVWRSTYHHLFTACSPSRAAELVQTCPLAGPGSTGTTLTQTPSQEAEEDISPTSGGLLFKFTPDLNNILKPPPFSLPEGSDAWAMEKGWASVTPLRASFGEPDAEDVFAPDGSIQDRIWKMKL